VYKSNIIGVGEVNGQRGLEVIRRATVMATKTDVLAVSSLSASRLFTVQVIRRRVAIRDIVFSFTFISDHSP